jgi:hypothetical protein
MGDFDDSDLEFQAQMQNELIYAPIPALRTSKTPCTIQSRTRRTAAATAPAFREEGA